MNRLKEMARELDDTRHALDESHMIIAKIVDQLLCCIQDCEEALEMELTDGSEQVYEGRQEVAQSLLDTIEELTPQ